MQRLNRASQYAMLWIGLGVILSLGLILPGCCCGNIECPTALQRDYGRSVRNNNAAQVLNPAAGFDTRPPVGQSPTVAVNSQDRFDKTFKREEAAPPTMNLNVLGGGGK